MIHKKLGAKMSKFAGYEMPILYKSINYEHENVRKKLGVFDVSHMGEFFIEGPKAYDLLQKICSNDISKLSPGKAQYNYLPNFSGGVVDDLILYQLETERYLMVVNAANIDKDWEWIKNINKNYNADISDKSNSYGLLSVQGPKAIEAMQKYCYSDEEVIQNKLKFSCKFQTQDNVTKLVVNQENGAVFGTQPYLAIKTKDGRYYHDNFDELEFGKSWAFTLDWQTLFLNR